MRLLILIPLLTAGSGCRLCHNAWQTVVAEPIHYGRNLDDKLSKRRFTAMAIEALEEARAHARAERDDYYTDPFSEDHAKGFIDGFCDFLMAGGTGEPPPLPPRKYWRGRYQTPAGQMQIRDWFDGYRHGATVAQASNYRAFVEVPLSDLPILETEQRTYGRITARESVLEEEEVFPADVSVAAATSNEEVPPPRSLPPTLSETELNSTAKDRRKP